MNMNDKQVKIRKFATKLIFVSLTLLMGLSSACGSVKLLQTDHQHMMKGEVESEQRIRDGFERWMAQSGTKIKIEDQVPQSVSSPEVTITTPLTITITDRKTSTGAIPMDVVTQDGTEIRIGTDGNGDSQMWKRSGAEWQQLTVSSLEVALALNVMTYSGDPYFSFTGPTWVPTFRTYPLGYQLTSSGLVEGYEIEMWLPNEDGNDELYRTTQTWLHVDSGLPSLSTTENFTVTFTYTD